MAYFVFKESSSPVKASSFNPLSPDQLTLYRRLNPIKIWPTYAVPPTTTRYPRSTYDLWRAGSSPTIFQPVEKLIPLTTTSGSDQSLLYFRPTYALPDQGPLIADLSIFPERERAGVDRVSGVNGPLISSTSTYLRCIADQTRSKYDQSTLYRRPPRCTPAQHTTCGERDHRRPFFNRLKNLSRSPRPLRTQSGPDQPPLYLFTPTYVLPDQCPLIADPSIFSRAGVDRVSGVNGPDF